MRLFGQTFTASLIERIRAAAGEPGITRSALARRVCGWPDWLGVNGKRYHALGGGPLCGVHQRYLIRSARRGWLGALAFRPIRRQ